MLQTTNYNLKKYEGSDTFNYAGYNQSMEIIDTALKTIADNTASFDDRITAVEDLQTEVNTLSASMITMNNAFNSIIANVNDAKDSALAEINELSAEQQNELAEAMGSLVARIATLEIRKTIYNDLFAVSQQKQFDTTHDILVPQRVNMNSGDIDYQNGIMKFKKAGIYRITMCLSLEPLALDIPAENIVHATDISPLAFTPTARFIFMQNASYAGNQYDGTIIFEYGCSSITNTITFDFEVTSNDVNVSYYPVLRGAGCSFEVSRSLKNQAIRIERIS